MNSSKKTVLVVTGTRAEYGLLRPVMRAIQKSKKLRLAVVATGMHTLKSRGYTAREVKREMPSVAVVPISERDSMLSALAKEIAGIEAYCKRHRPDLILVLGDRDECFAGAIVGGHLRIPVAHIHGGDKTGYVVDEYIRHATTKFSHLHFPATKKSAERVRKLGEEKWRIAVPGGPGLDELRAIAPASKAALAKKHGLDASLPWHVVLHHPSPLESVSFRVQARGVFEVAASLSGEKIILSPNTDTGSGAFMREISRYKGRKNTHVFVHIPRQDLAGILSHARLLIGNSSMGIIDASYLKLPAVNVGNRQLGRERGGNVVDCGYARASIKRAVERARSASFRGAVARSKSPYGDGRASQRIVRRLEQLISRKDLLYKKLTYV